MIRSNLAALAHLVAAAKPEAAAAAGGAAPGGAAAPGAGVSPAIRQLALAEDAQGNTALHLAVSSSAESAREVVRSLLEAAPGAVRVRNRAGRTPAQVAAEAKAVPGILEQLERAEAADPEKMDEEAVSLLIGMRQHVGDDDGAAGAAGPGVMPAGQASGQAPSGLLQQGSSQQQGGNPPAPSRRSSRARHAPVRPGEEGDEDGESPEAGVPAKARAGRGASASGLGGGAGGSRPDRSGSFGARGGSRGGGGGGSAGSSDGEGATRSWGGTRSRTVPLRRKRSAGGPSGDEEEGDAYVVPTGRKAAAASSGGGGGGTSRSLQQQMRYATAAAAAAAADGPIGLAIVPVQGITAAAANSDETLQQEQVQLIKRAIARLPNELTREAMRLRDEGHDAPLVVAKQFLVAVRYAAKAALVRKGLARLVQGKGGTERFVPLDPEFNDPTGQREYLPGKAVCYGPDETNPTHFLQLREVMDELPHQWRAQFEARVKVLTFQLNVYSTNKNNRDSGPKEQTEVRPIMKYTILVENAKTGRKEPAALGYYQTDNQGRLNFSPGLSFAAMVRVAAETTRQHAGCLGSFALELFCLVRCFCCG